MNRRLLLPAVLALGLLTACTSSTDTTDSTQTPTSESTTTETAELSAEQATCTGFLEGTGTPLADRAENARTALAGGEIVDDASYAEVNVLEQRITELGADAPRDFATILDEVNAPFTAAVAAVNDARAAEVSEDEEAPGFPDLSTVDTTGSEAAQAEFEAACAEAGH